MWTNEHEAFTCTAHSKNVSNTQEPETDLSTFQNWNCKPKHKLRNKYWNVNIQNTSLKKKKNWSNVTQKKKKM